MVASLSTAQWIGCLGLWSDLVAWRWSRKKVKVPIRSNRTIITARPVRNPAKLQNPRIINTRVISARVIAHAMRAAIAIVIILGICARDAGYLDLNCRYRRKRNGDDRCGNG